MPGLVCLRVPTILNTIVWTAILACQSGPYICASAVVICCRFAYHTRPATCPFIKVRRTISIYPIQKLLHRRISRCMREITKQWTTLSNGYLGSRNDEERSEMRYVMRIAEFSESSNLWTQIALLGSPRSTPLSVSVQQPLSSVCASIRVGWIMRV